MSTDQIGEERRSPPRSEQAHARISQGRPRGADLEEHARALIRQRPVVAVLVAIGVGYLAARLVSRATR